VLVDDELLAEGRTVLELHEAPGEGETCWAHAVRHHEDQITFARRVGAVMLRVSTMLLVYNCEDDNAYCGKDSPYKQSNLPPELPGPRSACGTLCALARKQGIFFGDVAVAADVARGAVRKERASARHAGQVERKRTGESTRIRNSAGKECWGCFKAAWCLGLKVDGAGPSGRKRNGGRRLSALCESSGLGA
jgi:hypothetical protein